MFKLIRNRKYWYIISIILVVLSLASILTFGLRFGIDYKGGTLITLKASDANLKNKLENTLQEQNITPFQIKDSGNSEITIRTITLDNDQHNKLLQSLSSTIPGIQETSYDSIGPVIGKDLTNKSILAVSFASLAIILYVAFSFRKVPKPLSSWKFGVLAVVALIHDLVITTGFVSVLSHFLPWMEVDALFITALLTVMGFSVHDTIVIYDRLRENFTRHYHKGIEVVAEESVNQTLARSINTSLTTIIVLTALLLLGGTPIKHFIVVLILGIFIGTYSSIFVAAPLLVSWHTNRGVGK